ncbi:C-terminal processing protease CtpA/Prc, contains a PDZ domain [Pedobacter westerhofensis]|uniref:Tricorn protease homolog n=1 Tax=Pedobacter westerhofensis TaxID=425512 RepID=A0A521CZ13_9SPHI|nr:S41 family peptidase [Pedobacter westerhofensis]SMO64675.1 C-terminal processing protease CtpA/Prc, contains a PDZ domain [Pedobacter westerhofensis]
MKKTLLLFSLLAFAGLKSQAQSQPVWMQQPAVSPDGKWIAFEYKGNLFKVPYSGGDAVPLTIANSYSGYPIWSHDSKKIAFASDRYGNFDVYLMNASGGEASRLTYNSSRDIPYDFSVDDAKVIFGTDRHDLYSSARFPSDAIFTKLYEVPAKGGNSRMLNSAGMEYVHYNEKGDQLIFQDRKGYEDAWRKHHTSAVTRDIWTYNIKNNTYTKVSAFNGEDREPVWGSGDTFYYLSEKNGNQNLYKSSLGSTAAVTQLTNFEKNPVRNLSRSAGGNFVFTYNGDLYTFTEGQQPQKLGINLNADFSGDQIMTVPVRGEAAEMAVSSDGKQVAFVYRGDIFVTSVDGATTKRITNTPYQERMVDFSPDGRKLLYSAEHAGSWDIDEVTIANRNEPYFYAATVLNTQSIIATAKDEFQGVYSPDGKKIAFLEERNILRSYDIAGKTSRTLLPEGVNYSYADGDQYFTWSPDSKYLLAQSTEGGGWFQNEVVLIKDDGSGKRINLTESGFSDEMPQWGMDGKMMYWLTDKDGMKNLSRGSQSDIYAMFFDQKAWDRFQLSKEDFDLRTESEKKDTAGKKEPAKDLKKKEPAKTPAAPVNLYLSNLDNRTKRLTLASTAINGAKLSKDGEKLYFFAKYDKGYDLWVTITRTNESKVLAKLDAPGGGIELSKDGKSLFVIANGNIMKVGVDDGKVTPVKINSEMELNASAEREYILDHTWKQVKKKFFDPKLQGVDWDYYHTNYKKFLPYINNDYDFQVLLSEFLGELNASHTGGRYSPSFPNGDETAALGLTYDLSGTGDGLPVKGVIPGGPFDIAGTKMKAGMVIDKINGEAITAASDWSKLLNHKAGQFTRISFHELKGGSTYEETVKPIKPRTETSVLLYNKWVKLMEHLTDSLSGGKVGYVHVRSMDDPSFRVTFDKVLGKNSRKEALIVDSRFNGGGWLHDDLVTFLSGKLYFTLRPQGHITEGGEPLNKWYKPSCVLMSESNYSDAFMFPYAYKELGIGKLIGTPVAGTGTAVWWEAQINSRIVFGIPMIGTYGAGETHATENHQLEPDIMILNDYNQILSGNDQQLAAAVQEMLKTIKK